MILRVGDRVVIQPPCAEFSTPDDTHASWADVLVGKRATVVKEPWFLPFHDVYHVGLFVDDGKHAEIEVDWCQPLDAIDALAEVAEPPLAGKPWPVPRDKRPWWLKLLERVVALAR